MYIIYAKQHENPSTPFKEIRIQQNFEYFSFLETASYQPDNTVLSWQHCSVEMLSQLVPTLGYLDTKAVY